MHGLTSCSAENACTSHQHGFGNAVKDQYWLVSRTSLCLVGDHFFVNTIPRKRSLPLSSSPIVKLSEGWISFSVDKTSEADETSRIFLKVSST